MMMHESNLLYCPSNQLCCSAQELMGGSPIPKYIMPGGRDEHPVMDNNSCSSFNSSRGSEFEFDLPEHLLYDEPPPSPKLIIAHDAASLYFPKLWESAADTIWSMEQLAVSSTSSSSCSSSSLSPSSSLSLSSSSSSSNSSSPRRFDHSEPEKKKKKKKSWIKWAFNLDFFTKSKTSPVKATGADRLHQQQIITATAAMGSTDHIVGNNLWQHQSNIIGTADESIKFFDAAAAGPAICNNFTSGYSNYCDSPRRHISTGRSSINHTASILTRSINYNIEEYSRGTNYMEKLDAAQVNLLHLHEGGAVTEPVSPAASPSRTLASPYSDLHPAAAAAAAPSTPTKFRPMTSPHAQLYRQQRARAEEMKRKTFLPYRQPLRLDACFSHFRPLQPQSLLTVSPAACSETYK